MVVSDRLVPVDGVLSIMLQIAVMEIQTILFETENLVNVADTRNLRRNALLRAVSDIRKARGFCVQNTITK